MSEFKLNPRRLGEVFLLYFYKKKSAATTHYMVKRILVTEHIRLVTT